MEGVLEVELGQLDRRYEDIRRRDPRRESRLLSSLSEGGQQVPIVVLGETVRPVVLDGYKRVRCAARLGWDVMRATVWELPECEALFLERLMHGASRESALEQGWFLCALRERFGLPCEELARRFDRSLSWVSRRLGLVGQLPEAIQEGVRKGRIVPHAAMKYLLPMARATACRMAGAGQVPRGRRKWGCANDSPGEASVRSRKCP